MKNIQVIDGALNCTYEIYAASDEDFALIFPRDGQDIEFAEDFYGRVGDEAWQAVAERLWASPVAKREVHGIHGTLFFQLEHKRKYYPTKREREAVVALE